MPEPTETNREARPSEVEQLRVQMAVLTELLETYEGSIVEQAEALERALEESQQRANRLEEALSQLRQAQSRLIQTEKMSSLGQLAAGVAHEINTPVSYMFGNVTYLEQCVRDVFELIDLYRHHHPIPAAPIRDKIAEIDVDLLQADVPQILRSVRNGSMRVHKIVESLQSFTKGSEARKKYTNVHRGLDSTIVLLRRRLQASSHPPRPDIKVVTHYGNLPQIRCYPGELNQVFANLLTNAIDAIDALGHWPNTGDCADRSQPAPVATPQIEIITESLDAKRIRICFRNNGIDLPERNRDRLFEPFFTTKTAERGTGLGLSVCYQVVVERHGGEITCQPIAGGRGAEFTLDLPV